MADDKPGTLESLGLAQTAAEVEPVSGFSYAAVIGGGTMGKGLAQTIAQTGIEVVLIERDEDSLARSLAGLSEELDHEIQRWGMTESEKRAILARIEGVVDLGRAAEAGLVIESIVEDIEAKTALFANLDAICAPEAILVTNTASLSVTEIASATARGDRVIGMHFLNPVPKIPLVELVRGLNTSDDTFQKARYFAEKQLGKTAVEVNEYPGGITTRVITVMLNEAMYTLMEGVASADAIDTAIRIGHNFPVGPLQLADQIGLDEVYAWMAALFHELGDTKYRPCPLLHKLVRAGHLGVKTHRGFFVYDEHGRRVGANV